MLPSGHDTEIPAVYPQVTAATVVQLLRTVWPAAVVEDADSGELIALPSWHPLPQEFFVYVDAEAKRKWDAAGDDQHHGDTMAHVVIKPEAVTVVVNYPTGPELAAVLLAAQRAATVDGVYRYFWRTQLGSHTSYFGVVDGTILPRLGDEHTPVKEFEDKPFAEFLRAREQQGWRWSDDRLYRLSPDGKYQMAFNKE